CWRTVSVALDLSSVAAAYVIGLDVVVVLSKTMYSYDGPVIVDLSGFVATGTVIVSRSPPAAAEMSHPLQAMAYPWFIRNASAAVVGLLPPPERLKSEKSLLPRLLTSKKTLWFPLVRSTGLRM